MRRRLASEAGLTIVEVTVAAVVMVIGAIGVLGITDAATRNTYRAEQSQVVANRLQEEIEHLRQLPFDEVATTSAPASSTDPLNPGNRVASGSYKLNRDGTDPQPLVYNGRTLPGASSPITGGSIDPAPEEWDSGDVHGKIYRYVVAPGVPANCTGCEIGDLRRVIVAITVDSTASGGIRLYQEIQSDVINPDANSGDDLPPSGGSSDDKTISTFWLTDTSCNNIDRQALAGNHLTHNTRGACADGPKTGSSSKGAPDLLNDEQPPVSDAGTGTLYDLATDVEPAVNPSTDIGLNVRRPEASSSTGCLMSASTATLDFPSGETGTTNPLHQKTHFWVSNALNTNFRNLTSLDATLQLWTKTVNSAVYGGRLCVYIFKRITIAGTGQTVDVPATNAEASTTKYFSFTRSPWPAQWTEIAIPMKAIWASNHLTGYNIQGQPRLGIAVQLEKANTGATGLEFMYDHPNFASRAEVQTAANTPIFP